MFIILILFITIVLGFVLLKRNYDTYMFFKYCCDLCYWWSTENIDKIVKGEEESAYDWFYSELPSYGEIFCSFKPIKLETWVSKEKIDKIEAYD